MEHRVFLGVGHGGPDPGAVGNGLKEKDLNLAIALACAGELGRHGVQVAVSRTADEKEGLAQRIRECNAFDPELALDIHNNAGGGDGMEVYHHHGGGTGKVLAEHILEAAGEIGQNSRGTKVRLNSRGTDYFGFIRQIKAPAVLVECAFLDNAADIQILDTAAEQAAMGRAIAKGVLKTLGIPWKLRPLDVDGLWGVATTRRLQEHFGTAPDGSISNQHQIYRQNNPGLGSGWEWAERPNGRGSQLIRAMQAWADMEPADCDGEIGPRTIRAFQRRLGTSEDGTVSRPSAMVRALQRWANAQ